MIKARLLLTGASEAHRIRALLLRLRFLTGAPVFAALSPAAVTNPAAPTTGGAASGHHGASAAVDLRRGVDFSLAGAWIARRRRGGAVVVRMVFGPHRSLRAG
jgi:hypothetical protein